MKRIVSILLVAVLTAGLFTLCTVNAAADNGKDVLIERASEWDYIVYDSGEDDEPTGWLDMTDDYEWDRDQAPFSGPNWAQSIANTLFPYQMFTAYLRTTFTVADPAVYKSLTLYTIYDEDPTVYINGEEIWSASGYKDGSYNEIDVSDAIDVLTPGENVICVFFCNNYGGAIFDLELVGDKADHVYSELISAAEEWEYLVYEESDTGLEAEEPEGWLDGTDGEEWDVDQAPFAAPTWASGITNTLLPYQYFSAFLRKTFTVDDVSAISGLKLNVIYDENPTVYINGEEVWSAEGYKDKDYLSFDISESIGVLVDGENTICVAFSNVFGGALFDLFLVAELTEGGTVPTPTTETPVPTTETPVPTTETPVPTTDTPVPTTDTPVPTTETPVPTTETPDPADSGLINAPFDPGALVVWMLG